MRYRDECFARCRLLLAACLVACVVGLGSWSAAASAEEVSSSTSGSLTENPLVISTAEPLVGGQLVAAEEAAVSSPEAVAAREESASKYENLSGAEAAVLAREAFPAFVAKTSGGLPQLPAGVTVASYPSDYAAALDLGGGKRAVLESLTPVAVGSEGGRVPVNMSLSESGSGFAPKTAAFGVRIPKILSEGASLSDTGVSLTPVDEHGTPLASESSGAVDGASVFYGNVATDADVAVKPLGVGFDMQTVLRSVRSPEKLWFRIGAPQGARLEQEAPGGSVSVVADGAVIARILSVAARDAAGTRVPVSTVVSGDTLEVSVSHPSGAYRFPIDVDPAVGDTNLLGEGAASNWKASTSTGNYEVFKFSEVNKAQLIDLVSVAHNKYEWGQFGYTTQGSSRIYEFGSTTNAWSLYSPGQDMNILGIVKLIKPGEDEYEESYDLASDYGAVYHDLCAKATCSYVSGAAGNAALFQQYVETSGTEPFEGRMIEAYISIYQETGPTASFDTTDTSINGIPNAGTGQWVSPPATHAVLGVTASDPGIGIYKATVTSPQEVPSLNPYKTSPNPFSGCSGVQCYMCWNWPSNCASGVRPDGLSESSGSPMTYALEPSEAGEFYTWLPDGEDSVTATVENATKATSTVTRTIKIDSTPPTGIGVSGLPSGNEVGEGVYHIKAEATDGSGTTPSSGVASLALLVDGREVGKPNGSCPLGPCKASGEWTLNGAEYGAGKHSLVVVATDAAGNRASQRFTLTVHHATPVAVGPGSVDPQSGDFTLQATDVSVGGLGVTRDYSSRSVAGPEPGPVGAQWGVSLASMERLTEQPNGSTVLTDAAGGTTSFASNGSGGFESPKGDGNLKLESGVKGYVLKNEATKTSTEFTQPKGSSFATPTFASSIGWLGASNGALNEGTGVAVDAKGNIWVTDRQNARVEEFNDKGEYVKQFGTKGSGQGEFNQPYGIAFDPKGNFWVADTYNNRLEKFNSEGKLLQSAGQEGTGNAQFKLPDGVAADSKGDVWVADLNNNRIQELNENGEYLRQFGTKGSGNGQFVEPHGVTVDSKNHVWVTDTGNARVQEFTETGEYIRQVGSLGAGHGSFEGPVGTVTDAEGDVWVSDWYGNRVVELSEAGSYVAQFGSSGEGPGQFSHPYFLALQGNGTMWVTDEGNSRVQKWTHPTWVPTIAKGVASTDKITYAYLTSMVAGKPVTQPQQALAPVPAGVECSPTLKPGCRALTFNYATSKTATGEGHTEWGDIEGNLTRVYYTAYDPVSKAMKTVEVAHYLYDYQGRLRAEWDPRIPGELKTEYGYDGEGHLTAIDPPGQESWALTYGAGAGDPDTGRLLKAMRGSAATAIWNGEQLKNTVAPMITGTPAVGVRLAVSNGSWTGAPLTYGYQWKDCDSKGESCAAILGATNANYIPVSNDVGHTLLAQITAVNGGGSLVASSVYSGVVVAKAGSYTQTVDSGYSVNAVSCIPGTSTCVLSDSAGKALYATNVSASSSATWSSWNGPGVSPSQAVACPASTLCLLAAGKEAAGGSLYYATSLGGSWTLAYSPSYGVDAISCVSTSFCADGQDGAGYFRWATSPASTSWSLQDQGSAAMKAISCLSVSFCAIADSAGNVHVATTESQVKSSSWTQTDVDGTTALNGISCLSTSLCVAVEGAGNELTLKIEGSGSAGATKHDIDGTTSLTGVACPGSATCAAVDATGHVFVSKNSGETWSTLYSLEDDLTAVSCASTSLCAATDSTGKVTAFNPIGTVAEGEARPPQSGSTVEYGIPVTGAGKAYEMSGTEVAKWGQTNDVPFEGAAVFPPDEPQGWPASDYRRASVYYLDNKGRTVNVATPSGGIATSEYNETNDVVRTLSADNRATALKEAKPEVAAKELDTQSTYNSEGTELLSTLGPKHTVKLANGKEVQARSHTVYSYDEGAPSEGGPFRLVTKTTQGAQIEGEAEQDVRTTVTSYSGQSNLGWTLRAPTSVTVDPSGLKKTTATVYDPATGNTLETRRGAGAAGPQYGTAFGAERGGKGKFNWPVGMTIDGKGNIWVADTYNNRVQEFSSTGVFIRQFGYWGTGAGQMEYPKAITVDSKGHVWIVDPGAKRVEEFTEEGGYVNAFGKEGTENGQFKSPEGLAVDSKGNVWVVDATLDRVQEFSENGTYLAKFGEEGTTEGKFREPRRIAIDAKGNLWVSDSLNCRIQEFNQELKAVKAFGSCGKENGQLNDPQGIAFDSAGHVWVADEQNNRIEEFSEAGAYMAQFGEQGSTNGKLYQEEDLAIDSAGHIWVLDSGNARVQEFSSAGSYMTQFGSKGSAEGSLYAPKGVAADGNGHVWVADTYNKRIMEYNESGEYVSGFGSEGTGPGQFKAPRAIAVDGKGNIWVVDQTNDRVSEFNTKGEALLEFGSAGAENGKFKEPQGIAVDTKGNVWVSDTGNNRIQEFKEKGEFVRVFGEVGSGNGQLKEPRGIAVDAKDSVWVADSNNSRIEELNEEGKYITQFGYWGKNEGQLEWPLGISLDANGNVWVADTLNNRVQEFTEQGVVLHMLGSSGTGNGQLGEPQGVAVDNKGNAWVADTGNNRIERWTAATPSDSETIFYTNALNTYYIACGEHAQWANMPCETLPSAQSETPGLSTLPSSTVTYSMYGQPAKTTSTVTECVKVSAGTGKYTNSTCTSTGTGEYETKTQTRTTTIAYDEAGRPESNETTSTVGEALLKVTDKYSATTGMPTEQSTSSESLKSAYNKRGQLVEYTDADGNITKYEYEGEGAYQGEHEQDGRPKHVDTGKGTQSYAYDPTTGLVKELTDSAAGTFTASYDIEGNLTSEGFPNAMSANLTRNAVGETTGVQYVKNKTCTGTCPETWYTDAVVPSIHGQWLSQQSTQASQSYVYDQTGRLTQVQDTPAGKGCMTHLYTYDEETNRTSLTTREPGTGGACASEGGSVENHAYDSANRLVDAGIAYDSFGNTVKLPASDAGGSELTSTFYQDSQLASQTQAGQTLGDHLDPAGRIREAVSTGKVTATEIDHYPGPGSEPSWTGELSTNYTRDITGIGGGLAAIQHNGETPILQLTNLHGDVIATATDSEASSKLASTVAEASEYGVPATEAPPKYSWLGAHELQTTLPSGVIAMGARSYVPQLGRFLQTDPVTGGSANAYAYTYGNPVNENDLSGEFTYGGTEVEIAGGNLAVQKQMAEEQAAREEAERKAAEAAGVSGLDTEGPEEEWGEEEGEEWGEEYAAWRHGRTEEDGTSSLTEEEGVLIQPLTAGGTDAKGGSSPAQSERCDQTKNSRYCYRYVCAFDKDVLGPVWTQGNYVYVEICGEHGKKAGRRVGHVRFYAPKYQCVVDFVGHVSTCAQIERRLLAEYRADNKTAAEVWNVIKSITQAYKEVGLPPPP